MADKKISELTALTGANVATDDQLVIVDTSAALTKSITIDEFKNALDTATGFVRITGDTMTGNLSMSGANITLGDSSGASDDRIVLGDDSDLLIYHNNPNSFISEAGNGSLFITTDGNYIILSKADASTYLATFQPDGPVTLYNSGSAKLSTTSTGVDVTGTANVDVLTQTNGAGTLTLKDLGGSSSEIEASGTLHIDFQGSNFEINTNDTARFNISSGGDIKLYEDTGTTAKLFWDASAESLGIGTTTTTGFDSGADDLIVGSGSASTGMTIYSGTAGYGSLHFADANSSPANYVGYVNYNHGTNSMQFATASTERMRIDSSGNVGIGVVPKTGGSTWQHIQFGGTGNIIGRISDSTVDAIFASNYYINSSGTDSYIATGDAARMFFNDDVISFSNAGSGSADAAISWNERMRIDSSGRILAATTSNIASSNAVLHIDADGVATGAGSIISECAATTLVYHVHFRNGNGGVGGINTNGSSTSYVTSSDYRLKENVVAMTGATDRLKQLNPSRFNFIADADTTVDGFLAHEVQTLVPEAITGTKDEVDAEGNPVYQGIDQSKLVPLLVATIKELEARITALENA